MCVLYTCLGTVTLVVLFKYLGSSIHVRLYTCLGIVTLVVLFKCLGSSIHVCLYTCLGTVTLVVLFKCLGSSICEFVHMFRDRDTCCFVQVSRVIHMCVCTHV